MANRDYDDDRRWDRGSRDEYRPDDWADRSGRGRQHSQFEDRAQGGFQAGRDWSDRTRGDWDDRASGRDQWAAGRDVPRGGMSQSGGGYGQSYGQSASRAGQDQGRGYGTDYGRADYGRGSQAQDDWGGSSRGYGYGSRQSQGDMGFGRDRGFGGAGGWSGSAGREGLGQDYGDYGAQGGMARNTWAQDDGRFGRAEEDRWNRSRGSMGGALGSGDRDYRDYRGDRDRSLLGEIANALGFGSDRPRDDRDRAGGWSGDQARKGGMGPKGYTRSDSRIEEDVNEKLSAGHLDASDVEVKVKDGEVTLSGTVRSRADKRRAEDIADDCSGVKHVQNNIRVQDNRSQQGSQGSWSAGGSGHAAGQAGSTSSTGAGQSASQQGSQQGKSEPNKF